MRYIDLSHPIANDTPVYPGDPPVSITRTAEVKSDGYQLHDLHLGTHIGTHIDAPAHMIEGGKTLGQYPLERFVGQGVYIDATAGLSLESIESANITKGSIVIFNTASYKHYHDPSYFTDFPVLTPEIAQLLADKGVKAVGLDTCSADITEDFPVHLALLQNDILIIENLTNLGTLADKPFRFYAIPLRLDLDGSPVRAFAKIEE